MPARPPRLLCPDCRGELRPDRTKMNIVIDTCPQDHGIFLDEGDVRGMVGPAASSKIRGLIRGTAQGECPGCASTLGDLRINDVAGAGCRNCGSLWFRNQELKAHVHEVRKRAYGAQSMAARLEVMRDAAAFYPAEVIAGILTDFQLEQEL
ncbi:MAG: zf-TFIIB domain-containing protein [Euryarchaeota archaeon]|nr:zf-TFIIB domain-containing protein [Euryarchaeota archaeon]